LNISHDPIVVFYSSNILMQGTTLNRTWLSTNKTCTFRVCMF